MVPPIHSLMLIVSPASKYDEIESRFGGLITVSRSLERNAQKRKSKGSREQGQGTRDKGQGSREQGQGNRDKRTGNRE